MDAMRIELVQTLVGVLLMFLLRGHDMKSRAECEWIEV